MQRLRVSRKATVCIILGLTAVLASAAFAAVLFNRTLTTTFTISHGNLLIFSDAGLTNPISSWTIGQINIFGDNPATASIQVWIKNSGANPVNVAWTAIGLDPALTLTAAYNDGGSPWASGVQLGMDHNQVRDVTLTLTVPTSAADGAGGFTFDLAVSTP